MLRIAIVGRPNVGKSALLNRLARRTVSIVHDQPGVTRDRIHAVVRHREKTFEFVDTGGIGLFETENTPKEIASAVQMQVDIAIEMADLILIIVDGLEGVCPLDEEIVAKLRKSGKRLWLVVNKLDLPKHEMRAADFFKFGIDPVFLVSASHGRGIDQLWSAIHREGKEESEVKAPSPGQPPPSISLVGRPNVGKSSLFNRLMRSEQVIVSEIPGTTRDSVELPVEFQGKQYRLVDTAGIRHKSKIRSNVEMYSRHWTEKSILRSDLVLLMLNAPEGVTRQDLDIAGMIVEHEKPSIIIVNKWDLNEVVEVRKMRADGRTPVRKKRRLSSRSEYEKELRWRMPFLDYAPLMFISALEGYHALMIWKQIDAVLENKRRVFTTGVLNRLLAQCQKRVQPPMQEGRRLKIYYATQKVGAPVPTFLVFVNQRKLWSDSYARYLENQLRKEDPLTGSPILFEVRERFSKDGPRLSKAVALDEG